jgi:hypothetical protein
MERADDETAKRIDFFSLLPYDSKIRFANVLSLISSEIVFPDFLMMQIFSS